MKNKLLITSALAAGSLMAGSIANAQTYYEKGNGYGTSTTTVGGDLAIIYSAFRKQNGANGGNGVNSSRGFGRESQLNVANRGKLNNGLDYAAGFSLEFDGRGVANTTSGTETPSISNENVYVDLIIGNTTLTVGLDHIQRGYSGSVPAVFNITELMTAAGSKVTYVTGAKVSESAHVGIIQSIPSLGLKASAAYAPRAADTGGEDVAGVTSNVYTNSAYEVGVIGVDAFGIKGLGVTGFYNSMARSISANTGAVKGVEYGVSYNFGTVAIGYDKYKNENGIGTAVASNPLGESTTSATAITKKYGATYAVDSNMTLGIVKSVTDTSGPSLSGASETVTALQLGYNFGPVALSGTVSKFTNLYDTVSGPTDQSNGRMAQVRVTTKF
jgi:Gram-negative porin